MSTHEAKVVRIDKIEPHPNADRLNVATVWGYQCVLGKDVEPGALMVFIEPDTLVQVSRPEFAFLADRAHADGWARIRAAKIRGLVSFGLLVPAPAGLNEGDNAWDALDLVHYEPTVIGGDNVPAPPVAFVKYDMENYRKYNHVLKDGEQVQITEKIHGCNARFVFTQGQLYCGSHTNWKKPVHGNLWWTAAETYDLEHKLCAFPDHVFYGEVYGQVQNRTYGVPKGAPPKIAFFDVLKDGQFLNTDDAWKILTALCLPKVPVLYDGAWCAKCVELAEGPSVVPGAANIREGCVVKPLVERTDLEIGRVLLKIVGAEYLCGRKR